MIFLTLEDALHVAERAIGAPPEIRDSGLLASALARPRASAFGTSAYPDIDHMAAALLHSLARNHPLVDGNKRLALGALIAFYGMNGVRLTLSEEEAYELVVEVASGPLDAVGPIARSLAAHTEPRRSG